MRRNGLTIGVVLGVIALVAAVWLVVMSPKRHQAASLKQDVDQLQSQLQQAQQAAAVGAQEQKSFPVDYRKLVVLGKAVPEEGDQASLLVQLQQLANRSGVAFQSIDLSAASDSATTPAPAPAPSTDSSSSSSTSTSSPSTSSTPSSSTSTSSTSTTGAGAPASTAVPTAAATEASAAMLPIGASVGPAGLAVMPYELKFTGQFFQIAEFLKRLDAMVHTRHGAVNVHGRLLTVDAFTLAPLETNTTTGSVNPLPALTADLSVTTYLSPADQGMTGGATPAGPAPATTTPAATPGSTASSAPTSSPVPGAAGPTTASP